MIFDVHKEIAHYRELDVECDTCNTVHTISRPDESAREELIDRYYFHSATEELELLRRAETLFDSRPQSNHRYIIQKNYRDRVVNPEDDSLIQAAIDSDPPLKEFLNHHWFSFHPRKQGIENSVQQLRGKLTSSKVPCPVCGGALRLTEECHDACGGCFFSDEARLKWIARHVEWSRAEP